MVSVCMLQSRKQIFEEETHIPTAPRARHSHLAINSLKVGIEFVLMIVVAMGVGKKVFLWVLIQ